MNQFLCCHSCIVETYVSKKCDVLSEAFRVQYCSFTQPLLQKGSSLQEENLFVRPCVRPSSLFSFSEYSIIWWFRPCKLYIFWKHITLATSIALFWPSTTKYHPAPNSTTLLLLHKPNVLYPLLLLGKGSSLTWSTWSWSILLNIGGGGGDDLKCNQDLQSYIVFNYIMFSVFTFLCGLRLWPSSCNVVQIIL